MNDAEIIIWSAAAGSIGLVVLLAAADSLYSRSRPSLQSLTYLGACWFFFFLFSDLPTAVLPTPGTQWLPIAQVQAADCPLPASDQAPQESGLNAQPPVQAGLSMSMNACASPNCAATCAATAGAP